MENYYHGVNINDLKFVIAFKPTRHFSYSSGSRSSMYLLMFCFAHSLGFSTVGNPAIGPGLNQRLLS
jgi:hypothetical protein